MWFDDFSPEVVIIDIIHTEHVFLLKRGEKNATNNQDFSLQSDKHIRKTVSKTTIKSMTVALLFKSHQDKEKKTKNKNSINEILLFIQQCGH